MPATAPSTSSKPSFRALSRATSTMPADTSVTTTSSQPAGLAQVEREEPGAGADLQRAAHRPDGGRRGGAQRGGEPVGGEGDAALVEADRPLVVVGARTPSRGRAPGPGRCPARRPRPRPRWPASAPRGPPGVLRACRRWRVGPSSRRLIAQRPSNSALPGPRSTNEARPCCPSRVPNMPANRARSSCWPVARSVSRRGVDRVLGRGDRHGGAAQVALHAGPGRGLDRAGLGDLVDHADRQRLLGPDHPAGEDEVLGPGAADQAGEALGAAAAGDEPERDLGQADLGAGVDDAEVAGQRELEPAAERVAGDGGHRGDGQGGEVVEGALQVAGQPQHVGDAEAGHLLDVGARGEGLLAADDDERADAAAPGQGHALADAVAHGARRWRSSAGRCSRSVPIPPGDLGVDLEDHVLAAGGALHRRARGPFHGTHAASRPRGGQTALRGRRRPSPPPRGSPVRGGRARWASASSGTASTSPSWPSTPSTSSSACSSATPPRRPAGASSGCALPARTHGVHHGHVAGVRAGQRYVLRAHGPWDPARGHRYNPHKALLDPYARVVDGTVSHAPALLDHVVVDGAAERAHEHRGQPRPRPGRRGRRGGPAAGARPARAPVGPHGRPGVPRPRPHHADGRGAAGAARHVRRAGPPGRRRAPAPARASPRSSCCRCTPTPPSCTWPARGAVNYWGYNTLSFFAPEPRYSAAVRAGQDAAAVLPELRQAVADLHAAGLEVLLDVVYNHTCEGGVGGPTLSWRGLDNALYYRTDGAGYRDVTGTGQHASTTPSPRWSARPWTRCGTGCEQMGVDGFRFDLAPALARVRDDEHGTGGFDPDHPFLVAVRTDPALQGIKMVAEPWDIGPYGWRTGQMPVPFADWNDRYRDGVRAFWLDGSRAELAEPARARRPRPRHPPGRLRRHVRRAAPHRRPHAAVGGQLRRRARRLHPGRPRVLRPQAQRGQRRGQPRRPRAQPVVEPRPRGPHRRPRGAGVPPPDPARDARHARLLHRRAHAAGGRRDWAAPSAATTTATASTTRRRGTTGSWPRGSATCSRPRRSCSACGRCTRCSGRSGSSAPGPVQRPDGTRDVGWFDGDGDELSEQDWSDPWRRTLLMFLNGDAVPGRRPGRRGRRPGRARSSLVVHGGAAPARGAAARAAVGRVVPAGVEQRAAPPGVAGLPRRRHRHRAARRAGRGAARGPGAQPHAAGGGPARRPARSPPDARRAPTARAVGALVLLRACGAGLSRRWPPGPSRRPR